MQKIFLLSCFIILFTITTEVNAQKNVKIENTKDESKMKITILYDNYVFAEGTQADWGFSCLIENGQNTILFDCGTKGDIIMHNIKTLKVDISKIDVIVISHNHGDHIGGLNSVLTVKSDLKIYMPFSTSEDDKKLLESTGASALTEKNPKEILDGVYLTGEMGDEIKEQSLILDTPNGLIVITGCSHPGIVNILKQAKTVVNKKIHLVFGGFHLLRHSNKDIDKIIDEFKTLGVEQCGCSHCTGDDAIKLFSESYANNFVKLGTGKVITIQK